MKRILLGAVIFAACSRLLMAGPEPIHDDKKAVVATEEHKAPCNWTGFYLGANIGYAFEGNADAHLNLTGAWEDFAEPSDESFGEPLGSRNLNADGIQAGGFFGYNYQWNNWVLGFEAKIDYIDLNDSFDSGILFVSPGSGDAIRVRHSFDSNYLVTIGPRFGYAVNKFLLYATGGFALADLQFSQVIEEPDLGFREDGSTDGSEVGWTVGGGLQYCVTEHWSARVEYRYADLRCADFSSTGNNGFSDFTADHEACLELHSVTLGLAYKF